MVLKCLKHAYQCLPAENSKRLSVFCLGRRGSLERAVSCGPPVSCRCHQWLQCAKSNAVDLQYWGWCIPPFSGEIAGGLQYVICLPSMIKSFLLVLGKHLRVPWFFGKTTLELELLHHMTWLEALFPLEVAANSALGRFTLRGDILLGHLWRLDPAGCPRLDTSDLDDLVGLAELRGIFVPPESKWLKWISDPSEIWGVI